MYNALQLCVTNNDNWLKCYKEFEEEKRNRIIQLYRTCISFTVNANRLYTCIYLSKQLKTNNSIWIASVGSNDKSQNSTTTLCVNVCLCLFKWAARDFNDQIDAIKAVTISIRKQNECNYYWFLWTILNSTKANIPYSN